jgi:hypothetical protein
MKWQGSLDFGKAEDAIVRASAEAVRAVADDVFEESQRLVPNDPTTGSGDLHDSGKVEVEVSSQGAEAAISYGTDHAVYQHERLDYEHDSGESAKYLERPLSAAQRTAGAKVATTIRKGLS